MRGRRAGTVVLAVTLALLGPLTTTPAAEPVAPPRATTGPPDWRPDVRTARAYAQRRGGLVRFAVVTPERAWSHRGRRTAPMASTFKALAMVTWLRHPSVRSRRLRGDDRRLLDPMIRRSANGPASTLRNRLGYARLADVARRGGMRDFSSHPKWGLSRASATDHARFFLRLERLLPERHRTYALGLLRRIVPSQRWGIGRVPLRGWQVHFKGGWGVGSGRVNHQVVLLRRGKQRVAVAVMTEYQGSHARGSETLRGVFARLLRRLPRG